MPKGKFAGVLIGSFVAALTFGTFAAWNSYAVPLALLTASHDRADEQGPQVANRDAKGDRLTPAVLTATHDTPSSYSLASLSTTAVELPAANAPAQFAPQTGPQVTPRIEPRKVTAPSPEKPKRAEPQKLLLDDTQIAALRTRLKLTPTQEEFWPAVEVTLRNVVRQHARKYRKTDPKGAPPQIDINSEEVQQLVTAAVPLIMRLSETQKHEVRQLARIIGLETVASRI